MKWVLAIGLLALAGCDQMARQPRYDAYGEAALFRDGKVLQAPPVGVVGRDDPGYRAAEAQPPAMSLALIERGRERFEIFCAPCHDSAGYGQGIIPARGFPHPPSFHSTRLRQASDRHIFDVISDGYGVMYPYGDRVPPGDRWAIVAYIRSLQLSQAASVSALAPAEQSKVEAAHGG
jgi:mono/diheme cytochrome c family protein